MQARHLPLTWAVPTALALLLASPARADEGDELDKLLDQEGKAGTLGGWADRMAEKRPSFPYFEHHGYFRFRADFFHNGHLGTVIPGDSSSGTSGIPAPLTENAINNESEEVSAQVGTEDAQVIASANVRLRYSPTLHVSESLRVKATFDILDNLVLGSTPDFDGNLARPDAPLVAFAQTQASPSAGQNGFRDAVRVKEAYGEFQPAFLLRVGRMASNWGLGILANAGDDIDDDFGDYTDRALILFKVFGLYVAGAWDYVYSGAISDDPAQAFGQAKDLGSADDVNQWVISIFQRPLSQKERDARQVDTYERFKPSFDWGVYTVIRQQDFDLDQSAYDEWRRSGGFKSYDSLGLVPREAFAVIPDLWLRYEQRFDFVTGLRVELEAAGVFGQIDNINNELGEFSPRDISQFGAALEVQFDSDLLTIGLDAGFATGDSAEGFGILDRNTLAEQNGSPNREVTAFKFDRDYKTDLILFREVIGGITNAMYIKPYVAYDLFDSPEDTLGVRLDLQYAQALVAEATPGNESFLGFEADLRLFFHNAAGFQGDLEMGLLIPGGALNYRPVDNANNRDASLAFTLQGRLSMKF
ncbi:MAG: TIGR04551 family protein [Deltaproteobacteria bacterium]|nr:TIGR04551 family protein [Deltaproteobacteria bacterium]